MPGITMVSLFDLAGQQRPGLPGLIQALMKREWIEFFCAASDD